MGPKYLRTTLLHTIMAPLEILKCFNNKMIIFIVKEIQKEEILMTQTEVKNIIHLEKTILQIPQEK